MDGKNFGKMRYIHVARDPAFRRLTRVWELDIVWRILGIVLERLSDLDDV
jgi:hypothetical protein